jgi:hypothetical protein
VGRGRDQFAIKGRASNFRQRVRDRHQRARG